MWNDKFIRKTFQKILLLISYGDEFCVYYFVGHGIRSGRKINKHFTRWNRSVAGEPFYHVLKRKKNLFSDKDEGWTQRTKHLMLNFFIFFVLNATVLVLFSKKKLFAVSFLSHFSKCYISIYVGMFFGFLCLYFVFMIYIIRSYCPIFSVCLNIIVKRMVV